MKPKSYDFGGYATRHNTKCADGRVIKPGAFQNANGTTVPLVYHHIHDDISNVLGHAVLETRQEGVYAYCSFNNTEKGKMAKEAVQHGDITSLSIYANKLQQKGSDVVHGIIRELSLVLAGKNPGATIDFVSFQHGDDYVESEEDAIIYHDLDGLDTEIEEEETEEKDEEVAHAEEATPEQEQTVGEILAGLDDTQKEAVYLVLDEAVELALNGQIQVEDGEVAQSDIEGEEMKENVFDKEAQEATTTLSHSEIQTMFSDIRAGKGTFQEILNSTMLAHGITEVEVLFPEVKNITLTPETLTRQMAWVTTFMNAIRKSPFSRIKSTVFDLTADEARAKGYVKGREKADQVIVAAKRETTPQTIYKKQSMDRDDVVDITDFDVIAYIRAEMRVMLNEELARAVLIGDGRDVSSPDKINPLNIRPIWGDDPLYVTNVQIAATEEEARALAFMDEVIKNRKFYRGAGSPTCYADLDIITAVRLLKDANGYRLYKTDAEIAAALRVSAIEELEVMEDATREVGGTTYKLGAIIVNPMDYTIGATRGGEVTTFEQFDIDFNKQKYLIETRVSGALRVPKSALTFEFAEA